MKQMAYAKRILGGQGESKKQMALNSGYSPYVANAISSHIENKPGFHYAMSKLAVESNNLALSAMEEFKARGFKDFSNKELTNALQAIGNAWTKFNEQPKDRSTESGNKLRNIVLQQVENQVIQATPQTPPTAVENIKPASAGVGEVCDVEDPMDF